MGKLNKSELLEGVRNIIQESFNRDTENFDGTNKSIYISMNIELSGSVKGF